MRAMPASQVSGVSDEIARARANRRGILAMTACYALFIVNDALVKDASEGMPGGQTIFLRGCFSMALLAVAALVLGQWRYVARVNRPVIWWRAVLDGLGSVGYLLALFQLPIGNATAINSTAPLMLTAASAWLLGETVGIRRWSAVLVGFIGILLVIQPATDGFNAWSLLALLATALNVARDIVTRRIDHAASVLLVTFVGAIGVTVAAGGVMIFEGWRTPSPGFLLEILLAAMFLSAGYVLLVIAMRSGEVSLVSAFRYTAIPMALVMGWLRWDDVPDPLAWLGIVLLIAAGLYIIHRERVRRLEVMRR